MTSVKKYIIIAFLVSCIGASTYFALRSYLQAQFGGVIKETEKLIGRDIKIKNVSYYPPASIVLKAVSLTDSKEPSSEPILIERIRIDANIPAMIEKWKPVFKVDMSELAYGYARVKGAIMLEMSSSGRTGDMTVSRAVISNGSIKIPAAEFTNVSGEIKVGERTLTSDSLRVLYENRPFTLSFVMPMAVKGDPEPGSIGISGDMIKADINIMRHTDKITFHDSTIKCCQSQIRFQGEVSDPKAPMITMSGSADINIETLSNVNQSVKDLFDKLKPSGLFHASFDINGRMRDLASMNASLIAQSNMLRLDRVRIDDIFVKAVMKNGLVSTPVATARLYGGYVDLSADIKVSDNLLPFALKTGVKDMDIHSFVADISRENKDIAGKFDMTLDLNGFAADNATYTGGGRITIRDADLGPAPLLSPLLGNIYGFLSSKITSMKKVSIIGGECGYSIADRKIMTENLVLFGTVMDIYGRGYLDFDRNVNFEVRNEFRENRDPDDDIQAGILQIVAGIGKMFSRAYLTGTLDEPKWKFEYMGDVKNSLSNSINSALKGILR